MRSESRIAIIWAGISIYLTVLFALVFGFLTLRSVDGDWIHPVKVIEIFIAISGATFAILAMLDAHRAFRKAREVQEAVGSFRMNFRSILEEMVLLIRDTKSHLTLLFPTPGYGYLFGEPELSERLVSVLESFLNKENTSLRLLLVLGDPQKGKKYYIPQRYLQRARTLELKEGSNLHANEYIELVDRVFSLLENHQAKATVSFLTTDPNVRILVSDPEDIKSRTCILAFAQSEPNETGREFRAIGFRSTRAEMVQAVSDLIEVYLKEMGVEANLKEARSIFRRIL